MTTYEIPESLAARLPERSVLRFRTYVPSAVSMAPDLWERSRLDLLNLVADTEPPSDTDARTVLASVCVFYGWAVRRYEGEGVAVHFTAERLKAFVSARSSGSAVGTRANERGRLNRCLRVLAGEPATTRRQPARPAGDPYPVSALADLLEAARSSAALARVLAVALTTGKSAAQGVGQALPDHEAVEEALQRLGVGPGMAQDLPLDGASTLASGEWQSARAAAQHVGLDIASGRLRLTWAVEILRRSSPVADLIPSHGVSRRDLDNALLHAGMGDEDGPHALLRG